MRRKAGRSAGCCSATFLLLFKAGLTCWLSAASRRWDTQSVLHKHSEIWIKILFKSCPTGDNLYDFTLKPKETVSEFIWMREKQRHKLVGRREARQERRERGRAAFCCWAWGWLIRTWNRKTAAMKHKAWKYETNRKQLNKMNEPV